MSRLFAGDSQQEDYYFDEAQGDIITLTVSGIRDLGTGDIPMDFGDGESVVIEMNE